MPHSNSNPDNKSKRTPTGIIEQIARLQELAVSHRPDCTERQRDGVIQRTQSDSEGFKKDTDGVNFVDHGPTPKRDDVQKFEATVLDTNVPLKVFVAKAAVISIEASSESGDNWSH